MNNSDAALSRHTVVLVTGGSVLTTIEQRSVELLESAGCIVLIPGRDKIPETEDQPQKSLDEMFRALIESQPLNFPHMALTKWACLTKQSVIHTPAEAASDTAKSPLRANSAFSPVSIIERSPLKQRAPPIPYISRTNTLYCTKSEWTPKMTFEIIKSQHGGKRSVVSISEAEARRQVKDFCRDADESIASMQNSPFSIMKGLDGEIRFNNGEIEEEGEAEE